MTHAPCVYCGKPIERKNNGYLEPRLVFEARRFCDRKCFSLDLTRRPIKAPVITSGVGHYHARKQVPAGPCRRCGKGSAGDVHHIDGDYSNNDLVNLVRLCRSCHMKVHRFGHPLEVTA